LKDARAGRYDAARDVSRRADGGVRSAARDECALLAALFARDLSVHHSTLSQVLAASGG
jgi:hypothetical protein